MSQEQPPFGLLGPILAEIQRRPRSRIKFNCPPSVVFLESCAVEDPLLAINILIILILALRFSCTVQVPVHGVQRSYHHGD